jgi:hypothetical protein
LISLITFIGCSGGNIRVADVYVVAVNDFDQNQDAIPGSLRVFTSVLSRQTAWTDVTSMIALPNSRNESNYQTRPRTRPAVWSALSADSPIKFAVFYWDMFPPEQGNPSRGDNSQLVVATLSDDFGWTTSMPAFSFNFGNSHRNAFSPAVAELNGEFLVAWGEHPAGTAQLIDRIRTAKVRFIKDDSGNDINRYQLQQIGADISDPGFETESPITLITEGGMYILGFRQPGVGFVVSTSSDGINWSSPAPTDVPSLIPDPDQQRRLRPLEDPWGLTLVRRAGGAIDLTTVGKIYVGTTLGGENQLLRFRSGSSSLTTYTLAEQVRGLNQGTGGYVIAGPETESAGAFLDGNGLLKARIGSSNINLPAAGSGLVRTAPSIGFGHRAGSGSPM